LRNCGLCAFFILWFLHAQVLMTKGSDLR
jgi:hypothetical protein